MLLENSSVDLTEEQKRFVNLAADYASLKVQPEDADNYLENLKPHETLLNSLFYPLRHAIRQHKSFLDDIKIEEGKDIFYNLKMARLVSLHNGLMKQDTSDEKPLFTQKHEQEYIQITNLNSHFYAEACEHMAEDFIYNQMPYNIKLIFPHNEDLLRHQTSLSVNSVPDFVTGNPLIFETYIQQLAGIAVADDKIGIAGEDLNPDAIDDLDRYENHAIFIETYKRLSNHIDETAKNATHKAPKPPALFPLQYNN